MVLDNLSSRYSHAASPDTAAASRLAYLCGYGILRVLQLRVATYANLANICIYIYILIYRL